MQTSLAGSSTKGGNCEAITAERRSTPQHPIHDSLTAGVVQRHGHLKCVLAPVEAGIVAAAQPRQQQLLHPAPLGGVLLPARQQQLGQRDVLRGPTGQDGK